MTDTAGPPPRPQDAAEGEKAPVDVDQPPPALTKSEYAHTTDVSPASMAVIPAIKGDSGTPVYGWRRPEPAEPAPAAAPAPAANHAQRPNGVPETSTTLRLVRIDPWSVTRHAFVLSVALMIVAVVGAAVLWILMAMSGVFGSINSSFGGTFDIKDYLGFGRMVGGALVLSAINVLFMTALATIGAHLYNLVAAGLGGVEVTLGED